MMNHEPIRVWYCKRCRKPLKVEPRWALAKGCKCKVPHIPRFATLVSHG